MSALQSDEIGNHDYDLNYQVWAASVGFSNWLTKMEERQLGTDCTCKTDLSFYCMNICSVQSLPHTHAQPPVSYLLLVQGKNKLIRE